MNPLTGIYGAASGLRNTLFDRGRASRAPISAARGQCRKSVGRRRGKDAVCNCARRTVESAGHSLRRALARIRPSRRVAFWWLTQTGSAADFGDEPLLDCAAAESSGDRWREPLSRRTDSPNKNSIRSCTFSTMDFSIAPWPAILTSSLMTGMSSDRLLPIGAAARAFVVARTRGRGRVAAGLAADHPALRGKLVWRMKRRACFARRSAVARRLLRHCASRAVFRPGTRGGNRARRRDRLSRSPQLSAPRHRSLAGGERRARRRRIRDHGKRCG